MKLQIHIDSIKIMLSFWICITRQSLNVLSPSKNWQIVKLLSVVKCHCVHTKYVKHTCLENIVLSYKSTKVVDVGKVYRVGRHGLGLPWLLIDRSPACPQVYSSPIPEVRGRPTNNRLLDVTENRTRNVCRLYQYI